VQVAARAPKDDDRSRQTPNHVRNRLGHSAETETQLHFKGDLVKRSRGRGRRPQNNNNNNNPNRTYDSSGPEIKIRGSAAHVYEKYLQLARDAHSSGDRVMAENYLQHAEHYYRVMAAAQAQHQQFQAAQGGGQQPTNANGNANGNGNAGRPNGEPYYANANGSTPSISLADSGDEADDEGDEAAAE
jgi:hypothetical protein